jgi:tetratricopeptide (TPR) repeat protein
MDSLKEANRVLVWAAKLREIPDRSNKFEKLEEEGDEEELENEIEGMPSSSSSCPSSSLTPLSFPVAVDDALTNSDNAALCISRAYLHFQRREYPEAVKYCRQSLKFDSKYAPAWRCIALVEWYQQGQQRPQALDHFNKSLKLFPMNPYCLRSAAVAHALMGRFQEAVHMIQAAVEIGGTTHSLSWRAAGQITYLYDHRAEAKQRAVSYFQKAYELSHQLDFEAGRLSGQVPSLLCQPPPSP